MPLIRPPRYREELVSRSIVRLICKNFTHGGGGNQTEDSGEEGNGRGELSSQNRQKLLLPYTVIPL